MTLIVGTYTVACESSGGGGGPSATLPSTEDELVKHCLHPTQSAPFDMELSSLQIVESIKQQEAAEEPAPCQLTET